MNAFVFCILLITTSLEDSVVVVASVSILSTLPTRKEFLVFPSITFSPFVPSAFIILYPPPVASIEFASPVALADVSVFCVVAVSVLFALVSVVVEALVTILSLAPDCIFVVVLLSVVVVPSVKILPLPKLTSLETCFVSLVTVETKEILVFE